MVTEPMEEVLPIIRLQVRFNRPPEEIWEYFLDPILMLQWLGNEIQADLRVDGCITFSGENAPTAPEVGNCWNIEQMNPKKALLFNWRILGHDTLVLFRFRATNYGTALDIKHGAVPVSARKYQLPEHWNLMLANFKSVVELGEPAVRFDYSEYHPLTITRFDPTEFRQSVVCKVPPQLPFDVWTNPEKLRYFVRAERPKVDRQYAGIYTWWAEGQGPVVFTKMQQDKEIEFSWVYGMERETRVNIRFEEVEETTLVSLHHYGFNSPEDLVGYDIAWTSILAELKLICELGESGIVRITDWG